MLALGRRDELELIDLRTKKSLMIVEVKKHPNSGDITDVKFDKSGSMILVGHANGEMVKVDVKLDAPYSSKNYRI